MGRGGGRVRCASLSAKKKKQTSKNKIQKQNKSKQIKIAKLLKYFKYFKSGRPLGNVRCITKYQYKHAWTFLSNEMKI